MSKNIIKPEGMDLIRHLNSGHAICNKCGALMERKEDPTGGCDIYVCPSCKWEIDEMDYVYQDDEEEWTPEALNAFEGDVPPAGCRACGGPYPQCKSSCKLFDD